MAPAWWEWNDDDSKLIADENMMENEGDEGDGESVVGLVAGVEVRKDGEVEYMRIQCHSRVPEMDERTASGPPVTSQHSCHFGTGVFTTVIGKWSRAYLNSDAKRFAISCKCFKRGED